MLSLALFSGNRIDGSSLEPGEPFIGLALFGGLEVDFSAMPVPDVDVFVIALFGGVTLRVRPNQHVRLNGFSLFGGRSVEPRRLPSPDTGTQRPDGGGDDEDEEELPLEITAYAVFGGVDVKRGMPRVARGAVASGR